MDFVDSVRALLRLLVVSGVTLGMVACATPRAQPPEPKASLPFPEIRYLAFQGNTAFSGKQLRRVMVTQPRPFWPPWKRGEPYNPPKLQADLRRLKKFYFDRGFLDTSVSLGRVQEDSEARTVRLEILIHEAAPTIVRAVSVARETIPVELPPVAKLVAALPLRPGERLTRATFRQSQDLLLARLHDAGYARARVVPRTEVDSQRHTATVTFTLQPGERTLFGPVRISGAEHVKERAMRRQLRMREGDIYSATTVTQSTEALYALGIFQAVTPRLLNLEADDDPLRLDYQVRERKPRTIGVAFGFSTVDGFRFQTGWQHRNLFGGAESLRLVGEVSSIVQELYASLYFPYFLNQDTTLTQTVFGRREIELNTDPFGLSDTLFNIEDAQPAFDLLSVGGQTDVGHAFTPTLKGGAGLELSMNDFRNVDPEALLEAGEDSAEDYLLFLQRVELQFDNSDSRLSPTRGIRLRGLIEHASDMLLSDVSLVKLELEAQRYHRLWDRLILALRLRLGGLQPYGGSDDVPFNLRYFAGGPGSVRGFTLNRLGPLNASDEPIGGNSLIEGSIELRFPIVGAIGGVMFADFGNVFGDAFTYHLGDVRYAVGPGVRYQTLVGPLRFDVGIIVDPRSGEDFGRFEFSIGQAF